MINELLPGDEKVSYIRSFHSSTLWVKEYSLNTERFTFPLVPCWTQKGLDKCGPPNGVLSGKWGLVWCEMNMTFLWMSELDVFLFPLKWIMKITDLHCFLHRVSQFLFKKCNVPSPSRQLRMYITLNCIKSDWTTIFTSTAIGLWKHRIPSDLRS